MPPVPAQARGKASAAWAMLEAAPTSPKQSAECNSSQPEPSAPRQGVSMSAQSSARQRSLDRSVMTRWFRVAAAPSAHRASGMAHVAGDCLTSNCCNIRHSVCTTADRRPALRARMQRALARGERSSGFAITTAGLELGAGFQRLPRRLEVAPATTRADVPTWYAALHGPGFDAIEMDRRWPGAAARQRAGAGLHSRRTYRDPRYGRWWCSRHGQPGASGRGWTGVRAAGSARRCLRAEHRLRLGQLRRRRVLRLSVHRSMRRLQLAGQRRHLLGGPDRSPVSRAQLSRTEQRVPPARR
jgi:hypothetical protein